MLRACIRLVQSILPVKILFFILAGVLLSGGPALAQPRLNARHVFLRLPTDFFENTGSSLSEGEKYLLIANGSAGPWVIRTSMPDMLELQSLEDSSIVSLCLFRGKAQTMAAIGADMGPVCITELWKVDDSGGLSPRSMPPEGRLMDFFAKDKRIPADISVTTTFCVHPQGLEVRPQFWSPIGEAQIQPDNAVFYIWSGHRFSKRIVNIQSNKKNTPEGIPATPPTPLSVEAPLMEMQNPQTGM